MRSFRPTRPSPALVVALIALFVAMGGVGYAAFKLPKNSVGPKQIKANAVTSSKVKNRSLLAADFKAGQLPAGAKGAPCLASDPKCRGPKGDTGAQGPGTRTYNGQFDKDSNVHFASLGGGYTLQVTCDTSGAITMDVLGGDVVTGSFYGWGTNWDGTTLRHATLISNPGGAFLEIEGRGQGDADLDVTVEYTPAGGVVQFTHVDANVLVGSKCNYHALVTPPS